MFTNRSIMLLSDVINDKFVLCTHLTNAQMERHALFALLCYFLIYISRHRPGILLLFICVSYLNDFEIFLFAVDCHSQYMAIIKFITTIFVAMMWFGFYLFVKEQYTLLCNPGVHKDNAG